MRGPLEIYRRWFGGTKADPEAMHTPVYPIVHAAEVTVEVHAANGVQWDEPLLSGALEDFGRYLSGEVKVISGPAFTLEADADGSVTWEQVKDLVGGLPLHGPFGITMVIVPRIRDREVGTGYCIWRPDGGHCVVIQAPWASTCIRRTGFWRVYGARWIILHELCHTLHLPARREHRAALAHCTHACCVLFGGGKGRVVAHVLMRGLRRPGLCQDCQEELRQCRVEGHRMDDGPEAAMAWYTRRIELNPEHARAYAYRGEEHWRRGQLLEAIADLSRAIELNDQAAAWYSFRGFLYMQSKQRALAIEDLRQCLALRPDNAVAKANLDELLAGSPADGAEAGSGDVSTDGGSVGAAGPGVGAGEGGSAGRC